MIRERLGEEGCGCCGGAVGIGGWVRSGLERDWAKAMGSDSMGWGSKIGLVAAVCVFMWELCGGFGGGSRGEGGLGGQCAHGCGWCGEMRAQRGVVRFANNKKPPCPKAWRA